MHIDPNERDEVLLRRSAKGDEDSFTELYRRHQAPLYRFALRMTGNAWAAEEIVQDVFMTLMRDPKKYDVQRGTVGAFLYGVARNRVMKHAERSPRDLPLTEGAENGYAVPPQMIDSATPAHWAEIGERRERVRAAILELPLEFREAVVLCLLEELSYEEMVEITGLPEGTVKSYLFRARKMLKENLLAKYKKEAL